MGFANCGGTVNKVYIQFGPILFWVRKMRAMLLHGDLSRQYFTSALFGREPMLSFLSIPLSIIEWQSQLWQQRQSSSVWKGVCKTQAPVTLKNNRNIHQTKTPSNLAASCKNQLESHRVPSCAERSFILYPDFSTKSVSSSMTFPGIIDKCIPCIAIIHVEYIDGWKIQRS